MAKLRDTDLSMFLCFGIPPELLERAAVERVDDRDAREKYGLVGTGDLSGIVFPYIDPVDGLRRTARVRRDHPEIEGGQPKKKYVSAYGDRRHLYFPPDCAEFLKDDEMTIVLVEAEKSALALTAIAWRTGRKFVPIAMGGCYGWRGRIGRKEGSDGSRVDEIGSLPDLAVCRNRNVVVMLDSNAEVKYDVSKARLALARELKNMGASVRIADVPMLADVNGPDDLIAASGAEAFLGILDAAQGFSECALTEAENAIGALEADKKSDPHPAIEAIAEVDDHFRRARLIGQLTGLKILGLTKRLIEQQIDSYRQENQRSRDSSIECARRGQLLRMKLSPAELFSDLVNFFSLRSWLPPHGGDVMALFTMLTYCTEHFTTVPYLCFESATPGCGKSTCLDLLYAVVVGPLFSAGLTRAVLVRALDERQRTLLLDESEWLSGRSELSQAISALLHAGYRRGPGYQLTEGEEHQVREFKIFGPKVFAAIRGLTGALLDRCIVIHLERAPRETGLHSAATDDIAKESASLRSRLEALSLQIAPVLDQLRSNRPNGGYWPEIRNREAELWHPLLTVARACGAEIEQTGLAAARDLSRAKQLIQGDEQRLAQARELIEILGEWSGERFRPGELIEHLSECEAWGELLADKKDNKARSASVGRFVSSFRLPSYNRSRAGSSYDRLEAIRVIGSHLPQSCPTTPATSATTATERSESNGFAVSESFRHLPLGPLPARVAHNSIEAGSASAIDARSEHIYADRAVRLSRENSGIPSSGCNVAVVAVRERTSDPGPERPVQVAGDDVVEGEL